MAKATRRPRKSKPSPDPGSLTPKGARHSPVGNSLRSATIPCVFSDDLQSPKCELCGRRVPKHLVTPHHLIPKERGDKAEHRVPACTPCHKTIHATFSNKVLARRFTTVNALRSAPELEAFFRWIVRQTPGRNFAVAIFKDHPGYRRRRR